MHLLVKLAVDTAIEMGIQYATTGKVDFGEAAKDALIGMLNPLKTLERGADLARVASKGAKEAGDVAARGNVGKLPKPPTGEGTVPKSERDPKRAWTPKEHAAKRDAQDGKCATGCGTDIDASNSRGHHIHRHADGARTIDAEHAEVCIDCHDKLHSP